MFLEVKDMPTCGSLDRSLRKQGRFPENGLVGIVNPDQVL